MKNCSIDSCPNPHKAHGLCGSHYNRDWAKRNPEKTKTHARAGYEKHREAYIARAKKNHAAKPDLYRSLQRSCEKRIYYADVEAGRAKSRLKHIKYKELERVSAREWRQKNHDKRCAQQARRKAAELRATPAWADHEKIAAIYKKANEMQKSTGQRLHVDHVVPLVSKRVCGLHNEFNLQILLGSENEAKGNRHWPDGVGA